MGRSMRSNRTLQYSNMVILTVPYGGVNKNTRKCNKSHRKHNLARGSDGAGAILSTLTYWGLEPGLLNYLPRAWQSKALIPLEQVQVGV